MRISGLPPPRYVVVGLPLIQEEMEESPSRAVWIVQVALQDLAQPHSLPHVIRIELTRGHAAIQSLEQARSREDFHRFTRLSKLAAQRPVKAKEDLTKWILSGKPTELRAQLSRIQRAVHQALQTHPDEAELGDVITRQLEAEFQRYRREAADPEHSSHSPFLLETVRARGQHGEDLVVQGHVEEASPHDLVELTLSEATLELKRAASRLVAHSSVAVKQAMKQIVQSYAQHHGREETLSILEQMGVKIPQVEDGQRAWYQALQAGHIRSHELIDPIRKTLGKELLSWAESPPSGEPSQGMREWVQLLLRYVEDHALAPGLSWATDEEKREIRMPPKLLADPRFIHAVQSVKGKRLRREIEQGQQAVERWAASIEGREILRSRLRLSSELQVRFPKEKQRIGQKAKRRIQPQGVVRYTGSVSGEEGVRVLPVVEMVPYLSQLDTRGQPALNPSEATTSGTFTSGREMRQEGGKGVGSP